MTIRLAFVLSVLTVTCGCASTTYADKPGDERVQNAFEQPFRDVSWMRENPPDILLGAVDNPYEWARESGCTDILAEIRALDLVLGPDLDQILEEGGEPNSDANAVLSGAIGSLIGLPYRGIVRSISGAGKRERQLRKAILAGMVRRGFMKGLALEAGCSVPDVPLSDEELRTLENDQ